VPTEVLCQPVRPRWRPPLLLAAALAWVTMGASGQAATLPAKFAESQVATGLGGPTAMAFTPDGRLFVCQEEGSLRVIKNGILLPTPFVTLQVDYEGERGLLGVAVDPDFAVNQYVYVYYTATTPTIHNRVSRFVANGDVATPGSETVILELETLGAVNHNGGAIHFGADGKLYVAVGDNANPPNAQTLSNRLGKMLRINSDGSIPTDNPYYATATGPNRAIWAIGLRNPFTFVVQPGTGRIFINDVGQDTWEEINDGIAGSNYGWPDTEGYTTNPAYRSPLYAYGHTDGSCAITGGAFYNPPTVQFPASYVGSYFFGDYCGGWLRRYDPATNSVTPFATGIGAAVDLAVATDGSLYYLSITAGAVYRIQYTGSDAPTIGTQPADQTAAVGGSATFTVAASGAAPLSYQWQRNGIAIPGTASASYTLAPVTTSDNGASFRCVVSNTLGTATSNAATLTVTPNSPPTGTITLPAEGTLYSAGDTISYAGTGTDPEDGVLPASAFTWTVVFHHDTHTHPFLPPTSGAKSGSFVIPTTGHTEANVWYRIHLTVTDSGGLTHTSFRDVLPRTVTLQVGASPPGLQVTLDGQPQATPVAVRGVVGVIRTLGVVSPQTMDGVTYEFVSWSDGGAATHAIATPGVDTSYTASFGVVPSPPPPSPGPGPALSPSVALTMNKQSFHPGEMLQFAVTASNPGPGQLVDVYVGALLPPETGPKFGCPAGDPIAFFADAFTRIVVTCRSAPPQTFPALFRAVTLPGQLPATSFPLSSLQWPTGAPPGTYIFFFLLTPPNAFADGSMDAPDLLALSTLSVTLGP
jgi:glucose/arabinose dehydrogenase